MNQQVSLLDILDEAPKGVPVTVARKFEALALEVAERGFKRYSSRAVMHRLRWHAEIEQGSGAFKLNNNWAKPLAHWFLARHPDLPKFFEVRERDNLKLTGGGP